MKKLITILMTLFLFSSAYAESRVVDKLEHRDGIAYAVGEINTFTGVHLAKHSNGKRKFKVSYTNGLKHGLSTSWHYNGQKQSKVIYRNNKKKVLKLDGIMKVRNLKKLITLMIIRAGFQLNGMRMVKGIEKLIL
jgi:antitoxin component YwqK of YwqJK toxin-antitoxin module